MRQDCTLWEINVASKLNKHTDKNNLFFMKNCSLVAALQKHIYHISQ